MKSSVITNEIANKHFVENYRFKVLGSDMSNEKDKISHEQKTLPASEDENTKNIEPKQNNINQQNIQSYEAQNKSSNFDAGFVEELLKKTDELSSNMIKLQMQIENQESEFAKRLETEVARAKEDGKNEGIAESNSAFDTKLKELNDKFNASIEKLAVKFNELDEFILKNEQDLAETSISIAKEVIGSEVEQKSEKIAYAVTKNLLQDIKDAKNITLRVNPDDGEYLKNAFLENSHIKIELDDAISKGGVVIINELGNIDATLETRIEKLKTLVE
ncbi:flagellar assembly protein FliH [Campylobacter pinnipediorum]|uniref:flagellar assembly protein FliH n=1 Tax=Campylobacter pinnipediorum TaxID=1965231 RepID=UPI00084DBB88|nr:flagellar assembly protein FliH [Campylobacter pinnipediorum]AQW83532.1 flagellar export apparatus, flagellar assembly protein FliH [Campylobacter pinnipediorum subsp. pinnipediorum]